MHGLKYWRARGHLLAMYWRYKTIATLTLCHSPSAVHAGLRAALQGFHGRREFLPAPGYSESWFIVVVAFST